MPPRRFVQQEDIMEPASPASANLKNSLAFFVFSFVTYAFAFGVDYAAAEDVLAKTNAHTSIVYLCDFGPYFVGAVFLPMIMDRVQPLSRVLATVSLEIVGIVLVAIPRVLGVRLTGVCLISLANAVADVALLSMTTFYEDITSRAYSAGAGLGAGFGVIYYTGMTTWLSLSMETTLMSIVWLPLLLLAFYFSMDKKVSQASKTTHRPDITYSPLDTSGEESTRLTFRNKLSIIWENMPLAVPMFIGILGRNLLPQAIVTTLVFPDAPFSPRDHYQYYVCASIFGEVVGKSYGLVVLSSKCRLPQYTKHTWIFAALTVLCVTFLSLEAWYRFLQRVWVVIFISFIVGLSSGFIFDFTFAAASGEPSSQSKEFSRAILVFPLSLGLFCASLLGLYIEPFFQKHCLHTYGNSTRCITRIV